jgi:hypothetical protein
VEKIVASAIKFQPKDGDFPMIAVGYRHCNCFEWMFKHRVEYDKQTHIQGFMTNINRFVDRYEAAEIAWRARQVLEESDIYQKMHDDYWDNGELTKAYQLFSEDLW